MVRILVSLLAALDVKAQKAIEILEATGNEVIKQYIDYTESLTSQNYFRSIGLFDLYIGILDLNSDLIFSDNNESALDLELDQVKKLGNDCFIFILHDNLSWSANSADDNIKLKLDRLKKQLPSNCTINYFASSDELANLVNRAIYKWKNRSTVVSLENESETFFENKKAVSAYAFESDVLKLLSRYLMQQNKPFSANVRLDNGIEIDGMAIEGVSNLEGPTLIEVKSSVRSLNAYAFERLYDVAIKNKFQSILIIVGDKIPPRNSNFFKKIIEKKNSKIQLIVWDSTDLSYLFNNYSEYISNTKTAIDNIVSKSQVAKPDEWKKTSKKHIEKLKHSYSKNDLVLFLGAGVSASAKMPCWDTLISKLIISMISEIMLGNYLVYEEEKEIMAHQIKEMHGGSPLLLARYIHSGLGNSFEEKISKCLYEDLDNKEKGTSNLLDSISKLCIPKRDGPGVKSIVTYNFDDLIENHLMKLSIKYRSIYKDADIASSNELGIYHVHGFLPQNYRNYDDLTESLLIFSEERYHNLYLDPYFWSNLIQLNYFRENTCLMVGLSGEDPNLRRLLDIAAKKNNVPKHYIILKRNSLPECSNIRDNVRQSMLSAHHALYEKYFNDLGLNIIWCEDYDDFPQIINQIKE